MRMNSFDYGSSERIHIVIENDVIVRVQIFQLSEITELRWDGPIESIRVEPPEKATMKGMTTILKGSTEMLSKRTM